MRILVDGEVQTMDMADYLRGVLRAEMPASFELEALKAQAVAARSYTLYRLRQGKIEAHPDADACRVSVRRSWPRSASRSRKRRAERRMPSLLSALRRPPLCGTEKNL